ncbi:hypothetical protein [Serratia microhaemolytica]|uniref:hypothetical protein n=1 Tax=Serratia microhaemolytica TaxID=2675110 RepID=UPI000FDDB32D|nr:hypothetical protein [Serratia microhaemolytica]
MFIIYLWDKSIGESLASLSDFDGNENFLIRSDPDKYALLSELSSCDMQLFSDEQLIVLGKEITMLMEELAGQDVHGYLSSLAILIERAKNENKGILFSPF